MGSRELRQVRKEAAVSESSHVPQGFLAGASYAGTAWGGRSRKVHGQSFTSLSPPPMQVLTLNWLGTLASDDSSLMKATASPASKSRRSPF